MSDSNQSNRAIGRDAGPRVSAEIPFPKNGDEARTEILCWHGVLRNSSISYRSRDEVLRGGGELGDIIFNMEPAGIAALSDDVAEWLVEGGRSLNPPYLDAIHARVLLQAHEGEIERLRPASMSGNPRQSNPELQQVGAFGASRRGRRPSGWWPEFAAALAYYIHTNGIPNSPAVLENAMLQWLTDNNYPANRSTIQPAIRRLLQLHKSQA